MHEYAEKSVAEKVTDYIEQHLSEDLFLEKKVRDLNYSKYYLARAFAEKTGSTIYKYLQKRRLSLAAQQLAAKDKEAQDPEKDIQLYINSPGGSITAGFAIYDTMQYIKCDVSTICIGLVASFGAFLLAGGAKGKRIALPNAEIMIHQPAIHGNGVQRQATDIRIVSDHIQKSKQRLNRILA